LSSTHFDSLRAVHPVAMRDSDGTYVMIYFPQAEQSLRVNLSPRNGKVHAAVEYSNEMSIFTSPIASPDWVLDTETCNFGEPGKAQHGLN